MQHIVMDYSKTTLREESELGEGEFMPVAEVVQSSVSSFGDWTHVFKLSLGSMSSNDIKSCATGQLSSHYISLQVQ